MNWQDMTPGQKQRMTKMNNRMKKQDEEDRRLGKPDYGHMQDYISKHNGGSIRHAGLRVVNCLEALYDLNRDWKNYHEKKLKLELKKLRGKK